MSGLFTAKNTKLSQKIKKYGIIFQKNGLFGIVFPYAVIWP
jgi:hypothetical protein